MNGVVTENTIYSALPLAIALIPIIGTALVPLTGKFHDRWRNTLVLIVTGLVLVLSIYLFRLVWMGEGPVISTFSVGFGELPLYFRVDHLGAVFNLISALIWFLATVFSLSYMTHESRHNRYYIFYLLTLGGCLGVFLTADLFSLLLFFELMSIASYLLVIHSQSDEAMKAGRLYLYLGVFGGLCILSASVLIYWHTGTVELTPMLEQLLLVPAQALIAVLLVIGFGIKAGMVPLHIWLPKAHPVAPAPASALLSAIMIKAGAYGIFRTFGVIYTPAAPEISAMWNYTGQMGYILIWFGILTMFVAAFMALFQGNAKRILAYSSVSQMGYILMGVGCLAYLGFDGPMALGGFSMHVVNHAFFKAGMFMMVGAVYFHTGEIELKRLGGLWRDFPVTTVVFLFAAMGIAGIPLLNGYTSKVLLHHAIVEAYEHHHAYSLFIAERIFMLTGAMTTCYIARLFSSIFLGKKPESLSVHTKEPWNERFTFIVIGAAILFIGTNPFFVLKNFLVPLVSSFPFNEYYVNYFMKTNFWDLHDLQSMAIIIAMASVLFIGGHRINLFSRKLPYWLSIEYLIYQPAVSTAMVIYTRAGRILETAVDSAYMHSPKLLTYYCVSGRIIESAVDKLIVDSLGPLKRYTYAISTLEQGGPYFSRILAATSEYLVRIYNWWLYGIEHIFGWSTRGFLVAFYFLFSMDYSFRGKFYKIVNTSNFEYYLLIFFILLILILGLQIFL